MVEVNSIKFNVISNSNPLVINIPQIFANSSMSGSKRSKRIEIEDFKWLGTFPKDHKQMTLDGFDYENIPPNFLYFQLGRIITDGVLNKSGQSSNVIEFAHPTVGFEHFATLVGTSSTSSNGSSNSTSNGSTSGSTTTVTPVVDLTSRPTITEDIDGGNILQQWEKITSTSISDTLINVTVPTINSATISYSHHKILYSINNDHSDGIDLGNLIAGKIEIEIMANINFLQARKGARDPNNFAINLTEDLFYNENVLYPFERRSVVGLGKLTEDYVLRFRIYEIDDNL